ncbi:D-amino-acid transaminase [Rossellomorea vietnamensis]|uniref:D-alanine aminotransferase n=2 Tax=Rossellomorea TaxID=2837508 RepID=A0A5D4KL85_9BACI|nr:MULTISPECIES: D-amino-acid transaminase [Rossellomorea]TYR77073.1 D-amino-acid transaminase [Rossellomorea vietnamensis]TYS71109.1 D-amino-acid transaminase [Rossellomorea aquimaris]
MDYVILDGQILDRNKAKVDIEDRGYQFGDGIYEVIRVYNSTFFTADEHLTRLFQSAEKIGMTLPYTLEELKNLLASLVKRNNINDGTIYLQFSRGVAARQHHYPDKDVKPAFTAYTKEIERPKDKLEKGVQAKLVEDVRWLRCDIKSLNLLGNIMAKQEAAEAGCFEAILHRGSTVTEGSSSNMFIVKDGIIKTHPATNLILNGITRRVIMDICKEQNITIKEEEFSIDELLAADEIFLASTTSEVMPIVKVVGESFETEEPGEITRKLQAGFEERIVQQCGE